MRTLRWIIALLSIAIALLAIAIWRDPYAIVRAEYARQRIAAGLTAHEIEAGGYRWRYVERAAAAPDAPTLVLVHGYTGSKENWYRLAEALGHRYRLVIPDLPGWGESERKPGANYGYAAQADSLAAFIDKAAGGPVVLIGHSMGGGIAAVAAARHPEEVARVGLLNASGVRFDDNRFGADVLAGKNPFGVTDEASLNAYLDILFNDDTGRPRIPWPASQALIAKRRADGAFERSVLDRIGRGRERFLPYELAVDIRQPALLLWCRQDRVIDASALAIYAQRIPQAQKALLDGCGHMSLMQQPEAVARAIDRLIQEPLPKPGSTS